MSQVDFRLLLITDRHAVGQQSLTEVVAKAVRAGVKAVQLREKDLSARQLYHLAAEMSEDCRRRNCRLIVNDRLDIAMAVKAGGVHLPASGMEPAQARKLLPPDMILGASTHSVAEAKAAVQTGADYIVFGPVYPTASKLRYGAPLGLKSLRETAKAVNVPVFAIGGITPVRAAECLLAGAYGVAVITAILSADDPAGMVKFFHKQTGSG